MRAVRFHRYGDVDELLVEEVEPRPLGPREVLVRVRAAGINPGEAKIRTGALHEAFPAVFPSGQGSDLAGTVAGTGPEVAEWRAGDPVLGWSWERSSQAEYVVVPAGQLVRKPEGLGWEAAGALYVSGSTAYAAVAGVDPKVGETVIVSGATGGVGSLAVQLLRLRRVNLVAVASERHRDWLESQGATVVRYGPGIEERLRHALAVDADLDGSADAFLDFHGGDYPRIAVGLGIAPHRVNTLDYAAAAALGTRSQGSAQGTAPEILAELAALAATHRIEVPISAVYPLTEVRKAFTHLENAHPLGKVVLVPDAE